MTDGERAEAYAKQYTDLAIRVGELESTMNQAKGAYSAASWLGVWCLLPAVVLVLGSAWWMAAHAQCDLAVLTERVKWVEKERVKP
jgi:hypothetical protein